MAFFLQALKFYAVIADFGLSSVLLDDDAFVTDSNRCLKQRFKNGIEKKLKRLPDWMDWFKYLINLKSIDIDQEVLRLIKDRENVSFFEKKNKVRILIL